MSVVYGASSVKRERRTKAQMTEFREAIFDIVAKHQPCSARQVYYRAVVAGLIDKDGTGSRKNEKKVGDALGEMREASLKYRPGGADHSIYAEIAGVLRQDNESLSDTDIEQITWRCFGAMPFEWITDNTRTRYQADVWTSKDAAMRDMIRFYRRDLWRMQPHHIEVWCESDSIAGVLIDLCDDYGVPLLPCRGQAPKRFIYDSAQAYGRLRKPITVLYVGDFDPNGLDIGNSVRDRIHRYLPAGTGAEIEFERIAITPEQVASLGLPSHGLNPNIAPAVRQRFLAICAGHGIAPEAVEAEAMEPTTLRGIVSDHIERRIDARQWQLELAVEQEERRSLASMIGGGAE